MPHAARASTSAGPSPTRSCSTASAVHTAKVPTTPGDQSAGVIAAIEEVLERAGAGAGDGRGLRPRDDGRDQRAAGGARRPHGAGRHPRLRRPARDRPPGPSRPLPALHAEAGAAGRARAALRGGRANRPRGDRRARSTRTSRSGWRRCCARAAPSRSRSACSSPTSTPRTSGAIAERLRAELPGVHVSASHEVLPRFREYERCSTTVIDAYLSPLLGRYLGAPRRGRGERRDCRSRW